MLRTLLFSCLFFSSTAILFPLQVSASHIVGGELSYECLGNNNYLITLKVYRDCFNGQAPFDNPTYIFVFDGLGNQIPGISPIQIPFPGSDTLPNTANNPCLILPPNICVEQATFHATVNLPPNTTGYKMIYQRCCRNITIVNIIDPSNTGATYEATIPDSSVAICNSSPYFVNFPPTVICVDQPFSFDYSAIDPDGDSLVYSLCTPYDGATSSDPWPTLNPYPYNPVNYAFPYSAANPMGGAPPMNIDPETGFLTVTPTSIGQFVVGICVTEYRDNVEISVHRSDFQFNVTQCTLPAIASVPAVLNGCDAFSFTFPNYSTGATSYLWDFGVPSISSDTSNLFSPTYTYPDTGVYTVTLYANPGTLCGDTATLQVYVYPTFTGNMIAPDGCEGVPVQFFDSSTTTYGNIDSWSWNFANLGNSGLQNPSFIFNTAGPYFITLIVGNTLGCVDTVSASIIINPKPQAVAFPDTTICYLDNVQLFGGGNGNYLWLPNYSLSNNTLQNPLAGPDVTTQYILTVTNQWGCFDKDTITITVIDSVNVFASHDTVICPFGEAQLNAYGGYSYFWLPPTGLSSQTIPNPVASPATSTAYTVYTNLGSCTDSAIVGVAVKPLPNIHAGPDQAICIGDSVMIEDCCGSSYLWDNANTLTDAYSATPIAFPSWTTVYHVAADDTGSCPLTLIDSVTVFVIIPFPLITTPDTVIYLGTNAQLYAIGALNYLWTPSTYLNDPNIFNPLSSPAESIKYYVYATTAEGCKLSDSVMITVEIDPLVVFPNAFTPNQDGTNDYFHPLVFGYFETEIFEVFNRWGQRLYESNEITPGWDGKFNGRNSEIGTYVYYLKGKSLTTGKSYFEKGNVVLLR